MYMNIELTYIISFREEWCCKDENFTLHGLFPRSYTNGLFIYMHMGPFVCVSEFVCMRLCVHVHQVLSDGA